MKSLRPFFLFSLCAGIAGAQESSTHPAAAEPVNLENFVVTASPFARAQDEIAQPTSVLAGQRLLLVRDGTLGETLGSEPGISSSYFGPGASRPIIRGLGGDRIRVLTGGIGTLDASVISPDHAVGLDPLLIDRIEILRGPATLLYGGSAIGGVVNVIDSRIPEELPSAALSGRFEGRVGSAADERSGAAVLTGAAGRFAWRLDGFRRTTDDTRIPDFAETPALRLDHDEDEDGPPAHGFVPNTATDTGGAGLGVSYIGAKGHIGLSYTGLDSRYGVPGHVHHEHDEEEHEEHAAEAEGVKIDLRQRRTDLHAEWLEPNGMLRAVKLQAGVARYRHEEIEEGDVATRFRNRAYEGRAEFLHEQIGPFEGALGVHVARSDFSAEGDEAFVPPTVTTNRAVFLYEEIPGQSLTWQLGGRLERQEISPREASVPVRRHTLAGAAVGFVWKLDEVHTLALSATRSERAPNAQELFANGPHAGTGAYEVGDPDLDPERSLGLDLSLRRRTGRVTGSATVFLNEFGNYLFEQETGLVDPDHELPIYQFVQRRARFYGGEAEMILHLHEARGHQADFRVSADYVRGTDRTTNTPLPRLTPFRITAGVDYRLGNWSFTAEARHVAAARHRAVGETPTSDYTLVNAYVSHRIKQGAVSADLFLRGTNLLDRTARLHTSFLKDVAPLAGRDIVAGVRLSF